MREIRVKIGGGTKKDALNTKKESLAVPLIWLEVGLFTGFYWDGDVPRVTKKHNFNYNNKIVFIIHIEMPSGEGIGSSTISGYDYSTTDTVEECKHEWSIPGFNPSWNWAYIIFAGDWDGGNPTKGFDAAYFCYGLRKLYVWTNEIWNGWRSKNPYSINVTEPPPPPETITKFVGAISVPGSLPPQSAGDKPLLCNSVTWKNTGDKAGSCYMNIYEATAAGDNIGIPQTGKNVFLSPGISTTATNLYPTVSGLSKDYPADSTLYLCFVTFGEDETPPSCSAGSIAIPIEKAKVFIIKP